MSKHLSKANIDMVTRRYITSALRKIWTYSQDVKRKRKEAMLARGKYLCEGCKMVVPKVQVDHQDPVGPAPGSRNAEPDLTWDCYLARLFCEFENFKALCKDCHKEKTARERKKK